MTQKDLLSACGELETARTFVSYEISGQFMDREHWEAWGKLLHAEDYLRQQYAIVTYREHHTLRVPQPRW